MSKWWKLGYILEHTIQFKVLNSGKNWFVKHVPTQWDFTILLRSLHVCLYMPILMYDGGVMWWTKILLKPLKWPKYLETSKITKNAPKTARLSKKKTSKTLKWPKYPKISKMIKIPLKLLKWPKRSWILSNDQINWNLIPRNC